MLLGHILKGVSLALTSDVVNFFLSGCPALKERYDLVLLAGHLSESFVRVEAFLLNSEVNQLLSEGKNLFKLRLSVIPNAFNLPLGDDLEVSYSCPDELPLELEGLELSLLNNGVSDDFPDLFVDGSIVSSTLLVLIKKGLKEVLPHVFGILLSVLDGGVVDSLLADFASGIDFPV